MTRRVGQLAVASVLVAIVAVAVVAIKRFTQAPPALERGLAFSKGDPDDRAGEHKKALVDQTTNGGRIIRPVEPICLCLSGSRHSGEATLNA